MGLLHATREAERRDERSPLSWLNVPPAPPRRPSLLTTPRKWSSPEPGLNGYITWRRTQMRRPSGLVLTGRMWDDLAFTVDDLRRRVAALEGAV